MQTRIWLFLVFSLLLTGCNSKTKQEIALKDEGIALMEAGNYDDAIRKLEEALKIKDLNEPGVLELDILKYRAEAEFKAGDYPAAEHSYEILSQVDADRAEYANMRVICLALAYQNIDHALQIYEKTDALADKGLMHEEALYELGKALLRKAEETQDVSHAEKAKELYSKTEITDKAKNADVCNMIGTFYYETGDYEKALEWLTLGMSKDAQNKELLYNQACCLEQQGEYAEALELFKKYVADFGEEEAVLHEIRFLETVLQ